MQLESAESSIGQATGMTWVYEACYSMSLCRVQLFYCKTLEYLEKLDRGLSLALA